MPIALISADIARRERYKRKQYRRVDERAEEHNLNRMCVLCFLRVPGGTGRATEHHEVLSKAELRGEDNWKKLFALRNIIPLCRLHHMQLGQHRNLMLHAMVAVHLATKEKYAESPWREHWTDEDHPVTGDCYGRYDYGSRYFKTHSMPSTLTRLYARRGEFNPARFCAWCPVTKACQRETTVRTNTLALAPNTTSS